MCAGGDGAGGDASHSPGGRCCRWGGGLNGSCKCAFDEGCLRAVNVGEWSEKAEDQSADRFRFWTPVKAEGKGCLD